MVTIFSRIINYGFTNFWRNGLLSTATVAIMTLSLLVFVGLLMANAITNATISALKDKIDISVYFKTDAPEDQILSIKSSLENSPDVKAVEYLSADQVLQNFKDKHANDPEVLQALETAGGNPFPAQLNIKAKDPSKFGTIADFLNDPNLKQYVDNVSYSKTQTTIDKLVSVISGMNRIGLTVTIILSLIAGLVIYNTIRLVIYSNRDEIGIMRAVGASNLLVRGPYFVEAIITGAISAVMSLLIIFIFFVAVPGFYNNPFINPFWFPGFNINQYFYSHLFSLLGWELLFGIGVAMISSFIAVRRYLQS